MSVHLSIPYSLTNWWKGSYMDKISGVNWAGQSVPVCVNPWPWYNYSNLESVPTDVLNFDNLTAAFGW